MPTIQSLPLYTTPLNANDALVMDDGTVTKRVPAADLPKVGAPRTQIIKYDAVNPTPWLYLNPTQYNQFLISYHNIPAAASTQNIYLSPAPTDLGFDYPIILYIDFYSNIATARTTPLVTINAPWGWNFLMPSIGWTQWSLTWDGAAAGSRWHSQFIFYPTTKYISVL